MLNARMIITLTVEDSLAQRVRRVDVCAPEHSGAKKQRLIDSPAQSSLFKTFILFLKLNIFFICYISIVVFY